MGVPVGGREEVRRVPGRPDITGPDAHPFKTQLRVAVSRGRRVRHTLPSSPREDRLYVLFIGCSPDDHMEGWRTALPHSHTETASQFTEQERKNG